MRVCLLVTLVPFIACSSPVPDDDDTGQDNEPSFTLPVLDCNPSAGRYDGQVTFSTAPEIETFFAEYNEVSGNVSFSGPELDNAPGMGCLVRTDGEVLIENTDLPFVDLRSLIHIGESLSIHDNPTIRQIAAPNLEVVTSFTVVNSNDDLREIDLSSTHTLRVAPPTESDTSQHALKCERNPSLINLSLESLQTAAGILELNEDDALESVSWPSLTHVTGALQVDNLDALLLFDLPALEQIGGEFRFDHNGPTHTSFGTPPERPLTVSVPLLTDVGDRVYVDNNPSALTMDFSGLTHVGASFFLRGSVVLPELDLRSLRTVAGDFHVSEVYPINELTLGSLQQVSGTFTAELSKDLTLLSAPSLAQIGGSLQVTQHEALTNLSFPSLVTVGGDLEIRFNPELPDSEICEVWSQLGTGLQGELISAVGCPL